jgi:hypothetical protein
MGSDPRNSGEKIIVSYIMSRVRASAEYVRSTVETTTTTTTDRSTTTARLVLTEAEQPVFNRYTYYGWMYGVPAAAATFGCLFGGLRFFAYRRWIRAQRLPNSTSHHARATASRQHYAALDRSPATKIGATAAQSPVSAAATAAPLSNGNVQQKSEQFTFFSDEIAVQVQFMVTAALALLVGTTTSNIMYDIQSFHRDLAKVPLQPGASKLCQHMCPDILQQREKLLSMSSLREVYEDHVQQQTLPFQAKSELADSESHPIDDGNKAMLVGIPQSFFGEAVLQLNPKELWENPTTEDLESMVILVENCRRRMEFEDECRRRNDPLVDKRTGLVTIPNPGVPLRYLKVDDDIRQ